MFKLFIVDKYNRETEVSPVAGVYIVYELYEYKFEFKGTILKKIVFIEDEVLDPNNRILVYGQNHIVTKIKNRIFENYFGFLTLEINSIKYSFEVRIQKLKIPELEKILLYLWNQDPIIFDNFFSKSTIKAKIEKDSTNLNYSSKFVNIFKDFHDFFKEKLTTFKSLPHNVIRTKNVLNDYEIADISSKSIDWLLSNLDELYIDYSFKNITNSIQIGNNYGLVEKILTEEKVNDFNIYENQIILGSFDYVITEMNRIKSTIKTYISEDYYYEKDFYSINEFKVIPFLKLKDDIEKIESKIRILYQKYRSIFTNTISKNACPKLTPVFANKRHYTEAFKKINLIRNININIDGEANLLNIKKLSTLYERFNLFVLINSIKTKNPISFSFENPKQDENVFQEFYFNFPTYKVSVYYDYYIGNNINNVGLQRISEGHYKPDYIIKIESEEKMKFYILDSKYSPEKTIKAMHLPKCVRTYVLDIGISNSNSTKIEELILLYPGDNEDIIYGNDIFKPKISILPSKVELSNLTDFLDRILFDK